MKSFPKSKKYCDVMNLRLYSTSTNSEGNYTILLSHGSYYIYSWVQYYAENNWTLRLLYYDNKTSLSEADLLELNEDKEGIDFIFPALQLGSISGTIRDALTQQPLSFVGVSVSPTDPGDSTISETDPNGNYYITVFEGEYILYAYTEGYYKQFYSDSYNSNGVDHRFGHFNCVSVLSIFS